MLLWDWVGVGGSKGNRASPPPHSRQPIGGWSWTKLGTPRPLGWVRTCLRPQQVGAWAGRSGTRGAQAGCPAPESSPQSPTARPPAVQQPPQDAGPGEGSFPVVLAYGAAPSLTPGTSVPAGHPLVTACPPVTPLVPLMTLSSSSHLNRSSLSQGTCWTWPFSLGDKSGAGAAQDMAAAWRYILIREGSYQQSCTQGSGPPDWACTSAPGSSHPPPCF